ncbi:hypothetical protein RKD21_002156 [Streptomyces albogriseolus]|uniref:Uncharacterized protein n=1 Tax=Streptomyces albogriseolus TaxID=1887 RepID=A0ACC6UK24_STRAO
MSGVLRLLHDVVQRLVVDGRHDQGVHALRDHVLDLRDLLVGVVLAEDQLGLVALGLEFLHDVVAVGDPALGGLGRHGDADGGPLGASLVLLAAALAVLAAGGQGEGEGDGGGRRGECGSAVAHDDHP